MIIKTHFNTDDLYILYSGLAFVLASYFFFRKKYTSASIIILTIGAFIIRFFVARLDPFIHVWDESLHALVARNMMSHPFKPMLVANPVLPTDETDYIACHIWLHKQPLFLWLMSISLRIFGINEMGVRLPSVLLSALITPMIYRIGKLLVNEKTGYYSAFVFVLSSYMLEVASGYIASDHNDAMFIFFVTASFWAWFEYNSSGKKRWIYIIGVFSGMAVLVKWLTGLLVYFGWMLSILLIKEKRKSITSYKNIVLSGIISAVVFIPWQVYILIKFKQQALIVFSTYSEHITKVLENHGGPPSFHIDLIGEQYGWIVPFILGLALYMLFKKIGNNKAVKIVMISWLVVPYLFFAIALTKMPLMTLICCPIIFISLGYLLYEMMEFIALKMKPIVASIIMAAMFIVIGFFNLNISRIEAKHTTLSNDFIRDRQVANRFKKLSPQLAEKDYVVFNCCCYLAIPLMFYSGVDVHMEIPDQNTTALLKSKNRNIAIFYDSNLPDYITSDKSILLLK